MPLAFGKIPLAFEILYLALLFFATYWISFHLVYWFENREKFKQNPKPLKDENLPRISLIVPAYNEEGVIAETIGKLKEVNYPRDKLEIVVIDDGSKDRTYEIAKRLESRQIKVLTKPNTGKASTLNFGIRKSKNEFIAVIDADSYMEKNALRECMKYFDEDKVAAVVSHVLVSKRKNFWEKMQSMENFINATTRKSQEFPNVIGVTPGTLSLYRKKILTELDGFDERNLVEDVEIAYRILRKGYKIRMAFDAMVYSIYPTTFRKWWGQKTRWVIGGVQTLLKHIDALGKKTYGVGWFLLPVSIAGHSSAFIGISIFLYLASIRIFNLLTYYFKSFSLGLNPFARWEMSFYPDIKLIYGFIVFMLGLLWLSLSFRQHKWKFNLFDIFRFLTVYSLLYPFISINGIYKYIKGERGWLTK